MGKEVINYASEYKHLYDLEKIIHSVILDSHNSKKGNLEQNFIALFKEKILNDYKFFFRKIGIHAGGFYFVNPWIKSSEFYKNESSKFEEIQRNYNTSYVFFDSAKDNTYFQDLIHEFFLIARDSQKINKLYGSDKYSSDFFNWMPLPDDELSLAPEEELLRKEFQIHYCTLGEIIFTCFVWRVLSCYDGIEVFRKEIIWNNQVFKFPEKSFYKELIIENEIFKRFEGESLSILNELEILKLFNHTNSKIYIEAVFNFLTACGINSNKTELTELINSPKCLFDFMYKCYPDFLKKIKIFSDHPAITEFEKKARFPILPYYIWNAIDSLPHTYLVSSIWNSVQNKYTIDTLIGESANVVFAGITLCATAPIYNEVDDFKDWTLPKDILEQKTKGIINSSILYIKRVLEILSKPLVEIAYYDNYREAVLRAKKKEIIAGIMARNLSHNFGSHILGNSFLYQNLGIGSKSNVHVIKEIEERTESRILKNISKFHHYIQARLDFISRIISNAPTQFETIFFFSDLIYKFTIQDALINTLIVDSGYTNDTFNICIVVDEKHYSFDRAQNFFIDNSGKIPNDFLIAIPGGNTGCHAFYSIIENQIRNAIKYGENQKSFVFTIELKKRDKENLVFDVFTYENSSRKDIKDNLNYLLNENIVENDGSKNSKITGSGLTEIKTCAEFIINKRKSEKIQYNIHNDSLAFTFSMYRPVIIGYYKLGRKEEPNMRTIYSEITEFNYISQFASIGSYFGILIDDGINESEQDQIISLLEANHYKFPYRLILLTKSGRIDSWKKKLVCSKVPINRTKVICNESLQNKIVKLSDEFEQIVLELYEQWLLVFKPLINERKYNLLIGFEDRQIEIYNDLIEGFESQIVDIYIFNKAKTINNSLEYSTNKADLNWDKIGWGDLTDEFAERCLVYDNHGMVFYHLLKKKSLNFYHVFGNENNELFQELINPPSNQYNFKFFIYSLLESSLLKILVVDERISSAYLEKNDLNSNVLNDTKIEIVTVINAVNILSNTEKRFELIVSDNPEFIKSNYKIVYFDAIVFHHGIFERLKAQNILSYSMLQNLLKITPVFIWTSGRGYDLERDQNIVNAQFMDFNELNYATYVSFNKFDLGKSIMSKYGKEDE